MRARGADATDVFLALSIATALFVALQYPMGILSDRRGRKPQLLFWSAATAVLIVPLSFLIGPGFWNLLVVFVVVPLFSLGYYGIEQGDASQFADLATKTDALYFTLSTLATVGFGDVHATGQLARALVSLQIVFDLVFVAALISVLTTQLRARAAARRAGPDTAE